MADTHAATNAKGLRITGTVCESAVVGNTGFSADRPRASLCLRVAPAKGLTYDIRQDLGTDPNAHIAANAKAKLLKRGAPVVVYGAGLRVRIDHDQAVLQVQDVTDVIPQALPPHHASLATDPARKATNPTTDQDAA